MTAATTTVLARVRNTYQTYTASVKCHRASCAAGPEQAVQSLARKVFPDQTASIEFVRRDGAIEIWRIEA